VEFRAIMYIPGTAPHDFYDNYYTKKVGYIMVSIMGYVM
jgi:hypothetical protein